VPPATPTPQKVRSLLNKGATPTVAAAAAGVTLRRVYQIIGVRKPKPRITDEQRNEIAARRGRRETVRGICAAMGVSRKVVLAVRPLDVPRGWSAEDAMYVRDRMKNHDAGTLARELDKPRSSVDTLIRRLRASKR
jgi:hypothetical protein